MKNKVHHFGVIGVINGLAVLSDRETNSRWDHITGEAFDGPLAGEKLDMWPLRMTTVQAALVETPNLEVFFSTYFSVMWWINQRIFSRFIKNKVWLPPMFYLSMSRAIDSRLPRHTQGLGVIVGKQAKYYPVQLIKNGVVDNWQGRALRIELNELDGVPYAVWKDKRERPMQLLTRWYGFSFTYPDCEIYEE